MSYIIPALAAILFLISLSLFVFSGTMKKQLFIFFDDRWVNVVIVFRMLAGFVVIAAAPASGSPALMIFIGIIIIFVAFTTSIVSQEKLYVLAVWWKKLPLLKIKAWALLWMFIWLGFGYIASPDDAFYTVYITEYFNQNQTVKEMLQFAQQCCF